MRPARDDEHGGTTRSIAEWHVLQGVVREKRAVIDKQSNRLFVENVVLGSLVGLALVVPGTLLSQRNFLDRQTERRAFATVWLAAFALAAAAFGVRHLRAAPAPPPMTPVTR